MNGRGTVYFDREAVLRDVPLLPVTDPAFAPGLILRTGGGVDALCLDDIRIALIDRKEALLGSSAMRTTGAEALADPVQGGRTIFLEDFESYRLDEPLAGGGWTAAFASQGLSDAAGDKLSSRRELKGGLTLDMQAPISGRHSGSVIIPAHATLTLIKPISWPERRPFAVSARPFAIVRPPEMGETDEQDLRVIPERDLQEQILDEGSADLELRGPHAGLPAAVSPARATLYTTTYYIYSYDGKLLAEYDATGVCQKDYIYMGSKLLAEYQPVTGAKYYYTSDQINSTRIVTDSSGAVVYSAVFDPHGGMQKQWVNTYQPSMKFSGKEREARSELDYFGARYYDHLKYRFLSVDPIINKDEALTNPQLWNLYSYCRNNPVSYFDPDGREIKTNNQILRIAIALAGATETGGPIVNSAIQSPNVLNMENANLETGNTGRLKEGSWVTEGGNFVRGNIVEITAQIDIAQTQSYGRPIVATVAHELMHGNTVITNSGKGIDAWRTALREENLPGTNIKAAPTVNGVAGRFGTAVAAEVASGLSTGNLDFLMRAASILNQIRGN